MDVCRYACEEEPENVNQQARHMDAFAQRILNDQGSRVSGEEGLRDLRIIEAIYPLSAAGGERVQIR